MSDLAEPIPVIPVMLSIDPELQELAIVIILEALGLANACGSERSIPINTNPGIVPMT